MNIEQLEAGMSVCNTITSESLDVESSCLVSVYIFGEYGSSSYMKVIGSRSKSQEQKNAQFLIPIQWLLFIRAIVACLGELALRLHAVAVAVWSGVPLQAAAFCCLADGYPGTCE